MKQSNESNIIKIKSKIVQKEEINMKDYYIDLDINTKETIPIYIRCGYSLIF